MGIPEDIVTQLVADGVGVFGTTIFIGDRAKVAPLANGATLHVNPTGGTSPDNTQNSTITPAYSRPGAQIVARGSSYQLADTLIEKAYLSLFKVRNQFINSGWYLSIKPTQEPFAMGVDTNGHQLLSLNVLARVSRGRIL